MRTRGWIGSLYRCCNIECVRVSECVREREKEKERERAREIDIEIERDKEMEK